MPAPTTIRDVNVRYHDVAAEDYDSKWGISYDEVGQAQVIGKLAQGARARARGPYERALEIGAGTGYFSLNLLRGGRDRRGGGHRHLAGHARRAVSARPSGSASTVETVCCEAQRCRSRTTRSTSSSATPSCTTCPTSTPPFASSGACCGPAGWWRSAASRRTTATGSPRAQARRLRRGAAVAARWWARAGRNGTAARPRRGARARARRRRARVHPRRPAGARRARRLRATCACAARSWSPAVRLGEPHARVDRGARRDPGAWRQYAYRGYLLLQALDRALLEPRLPPAIFYNLLVSARSASVSDGRAPAGKEEQGVREPARAAAGAWVAAPMKTVAPDDPAQARRRGSAAALSHLASVLARAWRAAAARPSDAIESSTSAASGAAGHAAHAAEHRAGTPRAGRRRRRRPRSQVAVRTSSPAQAARRSVTSRPQPAAEREDEGAAVASRAAKTQAGGEGLGVGPARAPTPAASQAATAARSAHGVLANSSTRRRRAAQGTARGSKRRGRPSYRARPPRD